MLASSSSSPMPPSGASSSDHPARMAIPLERSRRERAWRAFCAPNAFVGRAEGPLLSYGPASTSTMGKSQCASRISNRRCSSRLKVS